MRKGLALAALDLMGSLLLVVYVLINPPVIEARSTIETAGRWVAVVTWEASDNDVDAWLQQPDARKVWWSNPRSPIAHLEQDDLGFTNDDRAVNRERIVIRTVQPGEHILKLHCDARYVLPIVGAVTLWLLQGADRKVSQTRLAFNANGTEKTAFRFSLDESGILQNLNHLPARIVG